MTLERQLVRAEALAATLAGDRQERAQAVLAALATLRAYCADLTTARAVAIAWAVWDELNERPRGPDHTDVVELVRMHGGVRKAARALGVHPSTVSRRLNRVLRDATPLALPSTTPARRVGPGSGTERGGGADLFVHRAAPANPQPMGADRMLGNGSSKRPEIVSPQAAIAVLFERLERLEKLPANAEEAAKIESERLQIRRRLAEERIALIDALEREGIALAKRVDKARHALDYAAGPAARAAADEALRVAMLEQMSNSCAQELRPAALAKELMRTADPALDAARLYFEAEAEVNRAYFPAFIGTSPEEKARMRAEAAAAPVDPEVATARRSGEAHRYGQDIVVVPFLNGGYSQDALQALRERSLALKIAHARVHELKLLPLTHAEVLTAIEKLKAEIPPVPRDVTLNAFPLEGIQPPPPAPVGEGVYIDGVRQ